MQSASSKNIPLQMIPNPKGGGVGIATLCSGKELPHQSAPQQNLRLANAKSKPGADSRVPKYAKFLKELCIHKRKEMKGGVETGGIMSTLIKQEDAATRELQSTSIGAFCNRSIVQPLGILDYVLVQVNELIFLANFYVLDMEDEVSRKRSMLILG
ncbi:hypothetical protein CR513_33664, partial [Mucuna pruriens]